MRIDHNDKGEPAPYLHVRANLEARIDRKSFYRLVELTRPQHHQNALWRGISSDGQFFPFIREADI
jgi:hypothetical protein